MRWLHKLLRIVPEEELDGIHLDDIYWEVSPDVCLSDVLRELPELVPEDAIVYLEGSKPPKKIRLFLEERCVPEVSHVRMEFVWVRPRTYHLPATPDNLATLAELTGLMDREVATHLHVYRNKRVLLTWYEICGYIPIYLAEDIPEERLEQFCAKLQLRFRRYQKGVKPLR